VAVATAVHDETTDAPPPDAAGPDDAWPRDRRPTWMQVLVLAVACMFVGGAATYWWEQRPARPNDADVGFYDDMSVHHQQAIEMAQQYLQRGNDRVMRVIASGIVFGQAGDIRVMQNALAAWHKTPDTAVAMEWMGTPVPETEQPGMATRSQLQRLDAARGRTLDDVFSRLMINHHAGGIHMANAEAELGHIGSAREFAANIASAQRQEIDDLNLRREQLGLPVVRVVIP
jgi:uncharacterized protein (DUF305 family)